MSINEQAAIENMVFNYGSTYQTDYRHGQIDTSQRTVYKPKPKTEKTVPFERKDFHTLAKFAIEVPFSLCIKPKEIVRTNPYDVPKPLGLDRRTAFQLQIAGICTPTAIELQSDFAFGLQFYCSRAGADPDLKIGDGQVEGKSKKVVLRRLEALPNK